jgi:site-specific recombinase XerD
MTGQGIDGDFTASDTAMLNRFFTGWVTRHGQVGLNTRQRNLRHLFTWLEETYGHPHPYTSSLHRYAPLKKRPSTLAQEFIRDLLEVTGGGRARGFEDVRDHAMIRMLTEGVRRMELIQLELPDLSSDLIARPFVRVVPLKSARPSARAGSCRWRRRRPGLWRPTCECAARTGSRRPRRCGWAPATVAR